MVSISISYPGNICSTSCKDAGVQHFAVNTLVVGKVNEIDPGVGTCWTVMRISTISRTSAEPQRVARPEDGQDSPEEAPRANATHFRACSRLHCSTTPHAQRPRGSPDTITITSEEQRGDTVMPRHDLRGIVVGWTCDIHRGPVLSEGLVHSG